MGNTPAYPLPVFSHRGATANGNGAVLDVADINQSRFPPVMIITLGDTPDVTVFVEGSHDGDNFVDFSEGGLTADTAKDLIVGVRFWRTRIADYAAGSITSSVGFAPTESGRGAMPRYKVVQQNTPSEPGS